MSRHLSDEHDELDSHEPLLSEHDCHVPVLRDDPVHNSPAMSTVSAQSQELKYIFGPCPGQADHDDSETDPHSDYSHVNIRPIPRHSDGGSYMARPPPPPYNHRYEALANARTGVPFGYQQGVLPSNVQRLRSQPPPATASLEDVVASDGSRRRSWSPRQSAAGYYTGNRSARGCYSSNMVDWDTTPHHMNPPAYDSAPNYPPPPIPPPPQNHHLHAHSQMYSHYNQSQPQRKLQSHYQVSQAQINNLADSENLPPRLAPVSGVLSEKLSRNLIRPIAFKPSYARPVNNVCQICREDGTTCSCQNYAPAHSQLPGRPEGPLYPRSPSLRSVNTNQMSVYSGSGIDSSSISNRSVGYNNETSAFVDDSPGVNVDSSPIRKYPNNSSAVDILAGTPSPSDSGVGELEAMLKEREAEILTLRQVMDRNERAIFQVYEEKKSRWQQDLREIKEEYENKLKAQQDKAIRLEQALTHGPYPKQQPANNVVKYSNLQVEKEAAMAAAAARTNHLQSQNDSYHSEPENVGPPSASTATHKKQQSQSSRSSRSSRSSSVHSGDMDGEVTEEIAMKNTEIMALRAQLRTLQGHLNDKDRALAALREESASKSEELQLAREQIDRLLSSSRQGSSASIQDRSTQTSHADFKLRDRGLDLANHDEEEEDNDEEEESKVLVPLLRPSVVNDEEYVLSLEKQIDALRGQLQDAESLVETERLQWLEEKNKVIRYQKQLQLNYVQMQRKNTALEAEVEQLTMELESRDVKLTALNGEEESVC